MKSALASASAVATGTTLSGLAQATTGSPQAAGTWVGTTDPAIFQTAWNLRFTNPLPNPLDPNILGIGFVYRPDVGTTNDFTIHTGQIEWNVLGIPGVTTTVWGYGNYEGGAAVPVTFPGRSFVVQRNVPTNVEWRNNLLDASGNPLSHLLPVDQTISMQGVTSGVPIATHHHGGAPVGEFDGGPDQWQTPLRVQTGPGMTAVNLTANGAKNTYLNAQEAALTWYHDHAEGVTRINAYAGLAGLYVVRDNNEAALIAARKIPSGAYELPLVIQDKVFAADGSLAYNADPAQYPVPLGANFPVENPTHMPEMFGDVIIVNGVAWPNYDVEPREYRLRLLNGSDSRFYTLTFGAAPMVQIGTDLGFLNQPVKTATVTISPGERLDVVVDFSKLAGQQVIVNNSAATPFPNGAAPAVDSGADVVMRFNVVKPLNRFAARTKTKDTKTLRGLAVETPVLPARPAVPAGATVRRILLGEGVDEYGRITPLLGTYDPTGAANHGTLDFNEPATETPTLGGTEVWEFWNTTPDSHPMHLHLAKFRVLDRQSFVGTVNATAMPNGWTGAQLAPGARLRGRAQPAPAIEQGWKDTVVCPPGMVTRVMMTFSRPGKYVYHCHILSHEEHSMMRWFVVS